MIKELSKNIVDEVYKRLDEIYNHRKQKEGLLSCHNTLINSLKRDIDKWYKTQVEWENTQASPKKARSHNYRLNQER